MLGLTESMRLRILKAVQTAARPSEQEKERRRRENYEEVLRLSEQENGRQRSSVRCKECHVWCIRTGREPIIWPGPKEGTWCPLCQGCLLSRVSVV